MIDRPDAVTNEMLEYLDDLRRSGEINMLGAAPYLVAEFSLTRTDARGVLRYWMETFGTEGRLKIGD